jgi:ribosome biogenesis GTPase A
MGNKCDGIRETIFKGWKSAPPRTVNILITGIHHAGKSSAMYTIRRACDTTINKTRYTAITHSKQDSNFLLFFRFVRPDTQGGGSRTTWRYRKERFFFNDDEMERQEGGAELYLFDCPGYDWETKDETTKAILKGIEPCNLTDFSLNPQDLTPNPANAIDLVIHVMSIADFNYSTMSNQPQRIIESVREYHREKYEPFTKFVENHTRYGKSFGLSFMCY